MEFLKYILLFVFCQSLAVAQKANDGNSSNEDPMQKSPMKKIVFDEPDIVANYKILGEEVYLEAFGAAGVNNRSNFLLKNYLDTVGAAYCDHG
jgi:hypothetical protein